MTAYIYDTGRPEVHEVSAGIYAYVQPDGTWWINNTGFLVGPQGVISIDYPRFNPLAWGRTAADITVHASVAWFVHIRDGVSRWDADLRNVDLAGMDVRGGVSRVDLQLPRPAGTVRVRVSGGASQLRIRRPSGVAARIQIGGGASKLALDDQGFGAVGGPVRLESPDYSAAADRYEIEIGGGASKITIERE